MLPQKIVFLAPHDPRDPEKWSGTIHSIYRALENNLEGIGVIPVSGEAVNFLGRGVNKILRLAGARIDCRFSTLFALVAGAYLSLRLLFVADGPIVAIAASNYLSYLKTSRRIIGISDATFRAISELNPNFKAFPQWLKNQGDKNEARSLRRSDYLIYPSKWSADSARHDYAIASQKISELPFGPNIPEQIIGKNYRPKSLAQNEINIVFVSTDWRLKNGDKVIEICRALIAAGVRVRLTTIGKTPNHIKNIHFVVDEGFLHKKDPSQLQQLCEVYRDAHFLLLPTSADAYGIVLCEAQAFGVLPVTNDVGGTASVVGNGEAGLLLPLAAAPEMFANEILFYAKNAEAYCEFSDRCRSWYLEKANWANWSKLIVDLALRDR